MTNPKTPLNLFLGETSGAPPMPDPKGIQAAQAPGANPFNPDNEIIPTVQTFALDNPQAAPGLEIDVPGNVVHFNNATDSTVSVNLTYHRYGAHNPQIVGANYFFAGFPFKKLFLTWAAQAGKTIQLSIWRDPSPDQRLRVE